MAELDHLSVHSARLLPDVFPLPAGDVALPRTGYVPHQGHGIEYEEPHDKTAPLGETVPVGEAVR